MTDTDLERTLRATLSDTPHVRAVELAPRVVSRMRRTRARRRAGIAVAGVALVGAASVGVLSEGGSSRATDPAPGTGQATSGCEGMELSATGLRRGELAVVLRNAGPGSCDVHGFTWTTSFGTHQVRDVAADDDLQPGDPLAMGTLPVGGELLVLVKTDTCQSASGEVSVTFTDGAAVEFPFPAGKSRACQQPGFGVEITQVATTSSAGEPTPE